MSAISAVLLAAADTLDQPGAWTQGHLAADAAGEPVNSKSPGAICFCLEGAIRLHLPTGGSHEYMPIPRFLTRFLGEPAFAWNDRPERTQADVVAMSRSLAREAEADGL